MNRPTQRGFSLIELMIAVTLGLLLTLGIINIFLSSKRGYRVQDSIGRMQENSRYTIDYLARAVHLADFWSGVPVNCISTIGSISYTGSGGCDAAWLINPLDGLHGYAGGATAPTGMPTGCLSNYVPNSDVLVVRGIDPDEQFASAVLSSTDTLSNGKYFVRAAAGTEARLFDASIAANRSAAAAALPDDANSPGDVLNYRYQVFVYYLATFSGDNSPTLFVWRMQQDQMVREPLVAGVEMMRFEYGVDTNADLVVDRYQVAADVTNWANVLTVRMSVVLRGNAVDKLIDGDSYTLAGGYTYTPAAGVQKYMRSLVVKEAQVRNRVRVK